MAEVFVAAAPGEGAQARGLAEALAALGFDAAAGAAAEAEIAKLAEEARCIVTIWSRGSGNAPWLAALAALAMDRKKLVSIERSTGSTPAPYKAGIRVDLSMRDRSRFKECFQTLIAELEKLAPTTAKSETMPEALIKARAALLKPIIPPKGSALRGLGIVAAASLALFVVGFGTGRLINAIRSGEFLVATTTAEAAASATPTAAAAPAESVTRALTWERLEREPWRESATRLANADDIKRRAMSGEARSQTLACLGHLAGADGFLPSPTAAREYCDAAAAQHEPAGLYLSWVLQRSAPHAGISSQVGVERLAEAARLGWSAAQIDYGLSLAPDNSASLESQGEAGRLWLAAAERGDPRGQFQYARWLRDSRAGPRDPAAAAPYLERAANANQPEALHMLATLHRDGIGVARNESRARALYEQAAHLGHPPSMFNLADMIRTQDPERAALLYRELACMRDERQIQPLAVQRLRALRQSFSCR